VLRLAPQSVAPNPVHPEHARVPSPLQHKPLI
jgi:hypothetical protein